MVKIRILEKLFVTLQRKNQPKTLMKHLFLAAIIAVMGLSAMGQTLSVNATLYHPGGGLSWHTASGDRIDNDKLKKHEIRWVAASADIFAAGFKMNDTILVESEKCPSLNGKWVIKDRMGKRNHRMLDFLIARGDKSYGFSGRVKMTISKVK